MTDLIRVGQRFYRWEALEDQEWPWTAKLLCKCDCGTKRKVLVKSLVRDGTKSCGCWTREVTAAACRARVKRPIVPGEVFGKLTVIDGTNRNSIHCKCECGTESHPTAMSLLNGKTQSCGCGRMNTWSAMLQEYHAKSGHTGLTKHNLFHTWKDIVGRCTKPDDRYWHNHGAVGITVHPEWVNDAGKFIADVEAEIGPRPKRMSLLRIDTTGNYEPGNLMWGGRDIVNARYEITRILTLEQRQEAVAMVDAGFKQYDVAECFRVSASYIAQLMKEHRDGRL